MKKLLSIALISSFVFANSFNSALQNGKVKGDFNIHYERYNFKNAQDSGYGMYSIGLNYKSEKYDNFELNLGFRANDKFYELYSNDYDDTTTAILNEANIKYFNKKFRFTIGRNKETLQWIHGFQEEIKLNITPYTYLNIELLHSYRHARANNKEPLKSFRDINGNNGLNVLTVYAKKNSIKASVYYYNAPDLANWYGTSIKIIRKNINLKITYSKSSELTDKPNGGYFNVETSYSLKPVSFTLGYICTDKQGGLGSMTIARNAYDNMNPLEEGNHIFEKDAKTIYASSTLNATEKLSFTLNLGHINFQNKKANEVDFYTDYAFNKNLSLELCVDKYNSDVDTDDSTAVKSQLTYKF